MELLLVVMAQAGLTLGGALDGAPRLGPLLGEVRALLTRPTQTCLAAQAHTVAEQLRALLGVR